MEGDVEVAVEVLRGALALWRGPPLDGSDDEGLLRREAARLDELRWTVLEDRVDAELRDGRDAELVAELEALVGEAPLRERLHGHLMLALYRSGRQAEALRAFQAAREVLGEELGLDPGPELQSLEGGHPPPGSRPAPAAQGHRPSARSSDQHHGGPQSLHRAGGRSRDPRSAGGSAPARDDRRARGRREDAAGAGAGPGPARARCVPRGARSRGRPGRGPRRGGGRHRAPGGRAAPG